MTMQIHYLFKTQVFLCFLFLYQLIIELRKSNTENYDFTVLEINEYKTRKRYIDVELKLVGWNFNKDIRENVEIPNMPNNSSIK